MADFFSRLNYKFETIERDRLIFAWEPRGDRNAKVVTDTCGELDLRHAVDPFAVSSATPEKPYYRLHGRTGFGCKYEEDELSDLAELLPADNTAYVFFNNRYMLEDALLFQKTI